MSAAAPRTTARKEALPLEAGTAATGPACMDTHARPAKTARQTRSRRRGYQGDHPQLFGPVIGLPHVTEHWRQAWDAFAPAARLYRRHYSCRCPDRTNDSFMGVGKKLVLITEDEKALFGWLKNTAPRWDGQVGINCTVFRNEGPVRSSLLIREAMSVAWDEWPGVRLFTYVDPAKVTQGRPGHNPGYCFEMAGWRRLRERSKANGLYIFEALP